MREYFGNMAKKIHSVLAAKEYLSLYISGENSDFCRLNHNKIRQVGNVEQNYVTLRLMSQKKAIEGTMTLTKKIQEDFDGMHALLKNMRDDLLLMPEDPHIIIKEEINSQEKVRHGKMPPVEEMIGSIIDFADSCDLVAILARGIMYSGFSDSLGQFNWSETSNFNFDYSLYSHKDKAVKDIYAGFDWDAKILQGKINENKIRLELLKKPSQTLAPEKYRVFLSPRSVAEILSIISWGGFSTRAVHGQQSPLHKLYNKQQKFSPLLTLSEHVAQGLAPAFNQHGFMKPESLTLIENGAAAHCLVSPLSAKEFGEVSTGANSEEIPESLEMAGGDLESADVLKNLGTGIFISNLNYLNFSDRRHCKVTGLTRFATFFVENGELQAPIEVLRFDDLIFKCFGENLLALTREREIIFSEITYFERSRQSAHVPGALIKELTFTL